MGVRRVVSVLLALVGALVAVVALVVAVADKEVFDRPTVEGTVDRILEDPDVNRLLAREIVRRSVALGDLEGEREVVQAFVDQQLATPQVRE